VEDAAAHAERQQLLVKTAAVQRRINTKVAQAQTHLGAARTTLAHYDTELTRIERDIGDARGQIRAGTVVHRNARFGVYPY
jgi:hypothetical protein